MKAMKAIAPKSENNPLNEFEDLLESSGYDYDRVTKNRLHFDCDGKQGAYGIMLEWNEDAKAIKCSLVISATKKLPKDTMERCLTQANEGAWHGFFMLDGVGNTVFKTLVQYQEMTGTEIIEAMEVSIDSAIREADRFSISLALSNDNDDVPSLFHKDDEWSLENLTLMFSEPKGNA